MRGLSLSTWKEKKILRSLAGIWRMKIDKVKKIRTEYLHQTQEISELQFELPSNTTNFNESRWRPG